VGETEEEAALRKEKAQLEAMKEFEMQLYANQRSGFGEL
jgi:hypothetical protein